MSLELSLAARKKLDAYLDAVEDTLRKQGQSREERAAVVDELAGQIYDNLQSIKLPEQDVTLEQVQNVLSKMESAEAFGQSATASPPPTASTKPAITKGDPSIAGWIITGFISTGLYGAALIVTIVFSTYTATRSYNFGNAYFWRMIWHFLTSPMPHLELHYGPRQSTNVLYVELVIAILMIPAAVAPIVTTFCGLVALCKLHMNTSIKQGWRLAVALTLLFPLIYTYTLAVMRMHHLTTALIKIMQTPFMYQSTIYWLSPLISILSSAVTTLAIALIALGILSRYRPKRV